MALTSSSTLSDAKAQLNDNLNWEGSVTKATAAREALRWLLFNRPQKLMSKTVTTEYAMFEQQLNEVSRFLDAADTSTKGTSFVRGFMPRA